MNDQKLISPPTVEDSVIEACNLVAHDPDIRAVYLITPQRPTVQDLQSGCELARENNLQIAFASDGSLVIRAVPEPEAVVQHWHPHLRRPAWSRGLSGLDEGVR